MSWTSPPIARVRRRPVERPSCSPTAARSATRRVCSSVESSFSASRRGSARDAGAEERLFLSDELGRPEVTDERARLRGAEQVDGDGRADDRDPSSSKPCPSHQPRSMYVHEQGRGQRGRQPGDADHDDQVREAVREQVGLRRARSRTPKSDKPTRSAQRPPGCFGVGTWGTRRGKEMADDTEAEHRHEREPPRATMRPDTPRVAGGRQRRECEETAAGRQSRGARQQDHPVSPDDRNPASPGRGWQEVRPSP